MNEDIFHQDLEALEPSSEVRLEKSPKVLKDYRLPFWHQFSLLVMSSLLSLSSFLPLFFPGLATSLQSQQAYIAFSTTQGQLPYVETYSKAGFLYHALAALGQQFGGHYWLIALQLLAFYVAGIYLYKLVDFLTDQKGLGFKFANLFYLFNVAFGFGGFYPIQLATPFVLMGLWFLVTYIQGLRRDEIFIAYGLVAALALAFEPLTLLFWLLALLCLSVVNIRRGWWARGFYQNLAIVLGLVLIIYPLGYFVLNLQLLSPYLGQTLLGNLPTGFDVSPNNLIGIGVQLLALAAAGLLTGLVLLPTYFGKMAEQVDALVLMGLSTLIYSVWALLHPSLDLYQLLWVLPFGLLLTSLGFGANRSQKETSSLSRRRSHQPSMSYLKRHAFLPILVVLASLAWTGYQALSNQSLEVQRQELAAYLAAQEDSESPIYVWDSSAQLYLYSQRLSTTQFPVATVNTANPDNLSLLEDELLQGEAAYLIVNRALALPSSLEKTLEESYTPVELEGITGFALYKVK